jgi:hypothetical protein
MVVSKSVGFIHAQSVGFHDGFLLGPTDFNPNTIFQQKLRLAPSNRDSLMFELDF